MQKANASEMRMSLETLIRLGGYEETFEPLLTLILDNRPDAYESVLNALGEDHYSLLHWAAKRSTYQIRLQSTYSTLNDSSTKYLY